ETRFYDFGQSQGHIAFGEDPFLVPIEDRARLKTMYNRGSVEFSNRVLGKISGHMGLYSYSHYFNSLLITPEGQVEDELAGEEVSLGGSYSNEIGRLSLEGHLNYTLSGSLSGNNLDAVAKYRIGDKNVLRGNLHLSSRMPNFNFLHL